MLILSPNVTQGTSFDSAAALWARCWVRGRDLCWHPAAVARIGPCPVYNTEKFGVFHAASIASQLAGASDSPHSREEAESRSVTAQPPWWKPSGASSQLPGKAHARQSFKAGKVINSYSFSVFFKESANLSQAEFPTAVLWGLGFNQGFPACKAQLEVDFCLFCLA